MIQEEVILRHLAVLWSNSAEILAYIAERKFKFGPASITVVCGPRISDVEGARAGHRPAYALLRS